jgi:toxin ParE1/3/4
MLSFIWRASAVDDLTTIIGTIAERHFDAAVRLQSLIEFTAERLIEHPFIYRPGRVNGTREWHA